MMPHGLRAAEQGDGDGVEADAGVDVGAEAGRDRAEHLVDAGQADQRAGDEHRVDVDRA